MADYSDGLALKLGVDTGGARTQLLELQKLGESFGSSLTRAFTRAAFDGRKLSDVLRGLAVSLSRQALNSALRPLEDGVGNLFGQLFKGLAPSAAGNIVNAGRIVPFAQGGVIDAPAAFPLKSGMTGLMGEAGPEAILPLARGSDGKLGVRSGGGRAVSITVNIQTQDAESFRRSRSQVSALISRAAERGTRNL